MEIKQVYGVYFSPTGQTRQLVQFLGETLARTLGTPFVLRPWTLPQEREEALAFGPGDLVVVGCPTYAGRVPNKILPQLSAALAGGGALGVGVVTFGNRAFDNALAELTHLMEVKGFQVVGGGAFVAAHVFAPRLGPGRPNRRDVGELLAFAQQLGAKVERGDTTPPSIPGDPQGPYYVPRRADGERAEFLRAKPTTREDACNRCGRCVLSCPMGAINPKDPTQVPGTCIKCHSCIFRCPQQAKYFDHPDFLSHRAMLEANFAAPADNFTAL